MTAVNRARLLALSEAEFRREAAAPEPQPTDSKFRALRVDLSKYDASWDRKRGSAARMMAELLRGDDRQLTERVCESANTSRTYRGAADWLANEARYLRKVASLMDTAGGRLGVVLQRCGAMRPADSSAPASQS